MCEGLSLAGMTESPLVLNVGQRPAPATGLPTRTEQGDLNMVLYAGHGEFPRIIFAPATIEDAFYLAAKAFNLADKFQVPVFFLTDQFIADSYGNILPFDLTKNRDRKEYCSNRRKLQALQIDARTVFPQGNTRSRRPAA